MHQMHISDRRLDHFVAAVDTGSMLAACERVHLSQPALSRSIRSLETTVGVPLLVRHPRGVQPTFYGKVLLRHARLLRNQADLALAEIAALREGREGHLRLGVAPSFQRLVPAAVAHLLTERSQLTFELFEGTYDVVAEQVLAGDLDAAFSLLPFGEQHEGLELRPLMKSDFELATGADHELASHRCATLEQLAGLAWVMISRPPSLAAGILEFFSQAGVRPPARCIETDSVTIVKELLRSSNFVALLPREIFQDELEAGELRAVPISAPARAGLAGMITRTDTVHPPALDSLVEAVERERDRRGLQAP